MSHIEVIKKIIMTINASREFHGCIVEGPAGWGKTTAVEESLTSLGLDYVSLGAYSTPLNFYNFLAGHSYQTILLDDISGIFSSPAAMAVLKAATWPNFAGNRIIRWGSTSLQAEINEFEFFGKVVIVCNRFPRTPDTTAIRSRCLTKKVVFESKEAIRELTKACRNKRWFKNQKLAMKVANHLVHHMESNRTCEINFRTLRMGYELAKHNANDWKPLLDEMVLQDVDKLSSNSLIQELQALGLPVEIQRKVFEEKTGLKRRRFYELRKGLDLARPYNLQ